MSNSLKYDGIHDSHFEYIQTTVTSLFLGRFWKTLHQNKWFAKYFIQRHTYRSYIAFPFNNTDFIWHGKNNKISLKRKRHNADRSWLYFLVSNHTSFC